MFEQVETNSKRWLDLTPLKGEIWKPLIVLKKGKLKRYDNLYDVSNYGRINSLGIYHGKTNNYFDKPHIIKAKKNKNGYLLYSLSKYGKTEHCASHRIVATTFIENYNNCPQVNHIDGNKLNNAVDNLEWCSASYNIKEAYKNGLKTSKGNSMPKEKNPNCKFTENIINEIRSKRTNGYKLRELAKEYNISESYISSICNYKCWK